MAWLDIALALLEAYIIILAVVIVSVAAIGISWALYVVIALVVHNPNGLHESLHKFTNRKG